MSWPVVKFEDLYAEPSRNGIYKEKQFHGSGIRIVNMGELFAYDFMNGQEMQLVQLTDKELDRCTLQKGDLLFGRRSLVEAGAGKCSIVREVTDPMTFESSLIRVRLDQEKADPLFYFYWLKSPHGRGKVSGIVTGTNVKGIKGTDLLKIKVPYPDLDEQRRIATVLSSYDDLIENNRKRIKLLERAARLLYTEWFVRGRFPGHQVVKKKDGVPEGWEKKRLDELASVVMGQSPPSTTYNDAGDGLPFHQGVTDYGERFVEHRIHCSAPTRFAEPMDILLSVRAPVGRLNITMDRIAIGRGLCALRSRTGHQHHLFYQLGAHFHKEDLIGGGAIYASVAKTELFGQLLLTPDEDLIQQFEAVVAPIDAQIRNLTLQNAALTRARDLLLPRLMNGKVKV